MSAISIPTPIDGHTRLLGVIGDPVAHSLSPAMHNLALAERGINARYLAFHVTPERLPEAVRGFAAMGMRGFNATIPHKEALLPLMDRLDPVATLVGAVNTVAIDDAGMLTGYNTDGEGFLAALAETRALDLQATPVVMLGAGGAARAVLAALLKAGVPRLTLVNRTLSRAEGLLAELGPHFPGTELRALPLVATELPLAECGLLVNTTAMGLHGTGGGEAIPLERLPLTAVVQDIVYGREPTPLLREAAALGLAWGDGLAMLVHQGAAAFRIWTGQEMPVARVTAHLRQLAGG